MAIEVEGPLRELGAHALCALVRRYGDFHTCEDSGQEALPAAAGEWHSEGVPATPRGWLIRVASRRRIELWRNDSARRRREESAASLAPLAAEPVAAVDDTLTLL